MFIFKNLFFLFIIIFINGCTLSNFEKKQNINNFSVEIDTPNDKYNVYFKENLKRFFHISDNKTKFILRTNITFETTKTLSVSGQNILKSTKGKINYDSDRSVLEFVGMQIKETVIDSLSAIFYNCTILR